MIAARHLKWLWMKFAAKKFASDFMIGFVRKITLRVIELIVVVVAVVVVVHIGMLCGVEPTIPFHYNHIKTEQTEIEMWAISLYVDLIREK